MATPMVILNQSGDVQHKSPEALKAWEREARERFGDVSATDLPEAGSETCSGGSTDDCGA